MTDTIERKIQDDDAAWLLKTMDAAYWYLDREVKQGRSLLWLQVTVDSWALGSSAWRDRCHNAAKAMHRRHQELEAAREALKDASDAGE